MTEKINLINKKKILSNIYKHSLLTKNDLDLIYAMHEEIEISKGAYLLKESEISNEYYILVKGIFHSYIKDHKQEKITIDFFTKNELVIDVNSLFQRIPSEINITAITNCVCYKINFEEFQQLYHSLKGLSEWGRNWFSVELFKAKKRSISFIKDSASKRYLSLMNEKPQIIKYVPLKIIASYLGISDTSFSRIRKKIISQNE